MGSGDRGGLSLFEFNLIATGDRSSS